MAAPAVDPRQAIYQAHEDQEAIVRGEVQPPKGLNYMEEQYFKYGINANYHPQPIIGTNLVRGLSDNMTPDEYNKFFNYQRYIQFPIYVHLISNW